MSGGVSNGYDAVAAAFIELRTAAAIGVRTVRLWAADFPPGSAVLDLGCGSGDPVARVLREAGLEVWGVDASPRMVAAFRANFPDARVACAPVETFDFFGRAFDGAIASGLIFLLPEEAQVTLLRRVAAALRPAGSLLFTAPAERCSWPDALTGRSSLSLGKERYVEVLGEGGLTLVAEYDDEGENHYYRAVRA